MSAPSRRDLMTTFAIGACACGTAACSGPWPDSGYDSASPPVGNPDTGTANNDTGGGNTGTPSGFNAGNVSQFSTGDLAAVGNGAAVGRDSGGIYAMSTICTHAGCDMSRYGSVDSSGMYCSCHGSQFDTNGDVTRGPAGRAENHYQVTVTGSGDIYVDTTQTVSQDTRVSV